MQPQDATTLYLFRFWSWIESNRQRLAYVVLFAVVIAFFISFYSWRQNQKEIAAGQALSTAIVSAAENQETADVFLKVAANYPRTLAGQRALLQGAAELFTADKFADAQAQFQKFLDAHPDSQFSAQAALGVAASLEAQDKLDLAVGAYQRVINGFPDPVAADAAKFAIARIDEAQGKLSDALTFYEDVARNEPNTSFGSEAGLRAMTLKTKLAAHPATNAITSMIPGH